MSPVEQGHAGEITRLSTLYFPVSAGPPDLAGPYHPLAAGSPGGAAVFELDRERDHYLATKQALVVRPGRGPARVAGSAADAALVRAEQSVRARLAEADPARFAPGRTARLGLDALMLELQEDLAVLQLPAGFSPERARALYLHVCFPSGWSPAQMIGKSFLGLHARVPHEPGFARAERSGHAARMFAGPAVRFVWSLAPDAALDHHPDATRPADWSTTHEAFMRVERQLILPLTAAGPEPAVALFFIRTYIYPLARLLREQRLGLLEALDRMPEPVRRYKGLLGHEDRIAELVRPR